MQMFLYKIYALKQEPFNATVQRIFTCPGGEVVNAAVCKTAIRGFDSHPGLTYKISILYSVPGWWNR